MLQKAKALLYFLVVGWAIYIWNRLRQGKQAEMKLVTKDYELTKEKIQNEAENKNLDDLISDTNKRYRPGSGETH